MAGIIKILGTTFFIASTSTLHAGFYAGAGLGPDTVDFNQRAYVTQIADPGFGPAFDVINKVHLSGTGIFGTIFAGLSSLYNNWYLAGEVNANLSNASHTQFNHEYVNHSFSDTFLKLKNSYGISVLPGYQWTPLTLFYGRLGLTNSAFQQSTKDISIANFNLRRNGFRYGLGIKQAISERIALRMDYSRVAYNNIYTNTFDPVGRVFKATTLSPNEQLLELGVVVNL